MKSCWILAFYAVAIALIIGCGGGGGTSTPIAIPTAVATLTPAIVEATLTPTTPEATPTPATAEATPVPDTPEPTLIPATREVTPVPEATPTQQATPSQDKTGTLEIRVTDQPADAVSSILVTVKDIEVHLSGGQEKSGWQTVVEGPRQFDLKELTGIEDVLGSAALEPGRYQQLRFDVVEAVITVRGNPRQSPVPSGKIRLVGGFDVSAGVTTIVTLDIDAEKSVVFRPGQGPQLVPVVKMLVRKGGQPLSEAEVAPSGSPDGETTSTGTPEPSSAATGGGDTTVRVAIPTNDNLQFMSFWTAQGAGFFDDEGLDVQPVFPPIPDQAGQFMLQGQADVALLPPPMYLPLIEEGQPILLFANLIENDQINLIVRQDFATEHNLSTDLPLRDRLEAIQGMRVGVAPGPPTRLRVLFDSVGLDADSDIEMVIIYGAEQNQAFGDGTIDALYAHTPYLEQALVRQDAVVLVNQSAGEVPALANRQSHSLVTTRLYAAAQRDKLMKLTRAVHRAQQLIHTDENAVVEALFESGVPGLDRTLVETIVKLYSPAIPESPVVSIKGVEKALDLFPAHRTAPDFTGVDLRDYVDIEISLGALTP